MPIIAVNKKNYTGPERTIVVMGVARSGTSMVSAVLRGLDVFMGDDLTKGSLEDKEISRLLEKAFEPEKLDALLAQRNADYTLWGWKRPGAVKHANKFSNKLRNPLFILTFRDLAAIALRRTIAVDTEVMNNLRIAHRQHLFLLEFLMTNSAPCLLVSNETAVMDPTFFVDKLTHFIGTDFSQEQKASAVAAIAVDDNPYLKSMEENKANAQ